MVWSTHTVAIVRLSGEKAIDDTIERWASRAVTSRRARTFQNFTRPSTVPTASVWESGEKASDYTNPASALKMARIRRQIGVPDPHGRVGCSRSRATARQERTPAPARDPRDRAGPVCTDEVRVSHTYACPSASPAASRSPCGLRAIARSSAESPALRLSVRTMPRAMSQMATAGVVPCTPTATPLGTNTGPSPTAAGSVFVRTAPSTCPEMSHNASSFPDVVASRRPSSETVP